MIVHSVNPHEFVGIQKAKGKINQGRSFEEIKIFRDTLHKVDVAIHFSRVWRTTKGQSNPPIDLLRKAYGLTLQTVRKVMGGIVDEIAIERQQRLRWHIGIKPHQTRRIWRGLVEAFKQWETQRSLGKDRLESSTEERPQASLGREAVAKTSGSISG